MVAHKGFQVRSNLSIVVRERGKFVTRRDGHNVWINFGRTWFSKLITYSNYSPLTPEEDNRLLYLGFGIGGTRQNALAVANSAPLATHYPGPNSQTDLMLETLKLERGVRFSSPGAPSAPPYDPADVWLKQVQLPLLHPDSYTTRLVLVVGAAEIAYGSYLTVPLSEIGLFHAGSDLNAPENSPVAYDTFDTIPKTAAYDLTVTWTIRF